MALKMSEDSWATWKPKTPESNKSVRSLEFGLSVHFYIILPATLSRATLVHAARARVPTRGERRYEAERYRLHDELTLA